MSLARNWNSWSPSPGLTNPNGQGNWSVQGTGSSDFRAYEDQMSDPRNGAAQQGLSYGNWFAQNNPNINPQDLQYLQDAYQSSKLGSKTYATQQYQPQPSAGLSTLNSDNYGQLSDIHRSQLGLSERQTPFNAPPPPTGGFFSSMPMQGGQNQQPQLGLMPQQAQGGLASNFNRPQHSTGSPMPPGMSAQAGQPSMIGQQPYVTPKYNQPTNTNQNSTVSRGYGMGGINPYGLMK